MRAAVLVGVLCLTSCTTASVRQIGAARPSRPENAFCAVYATTDAPHEVQKHPVVEPGRPPGRPIARVTVAHFVLSSFESAIRYARRRALELGGDAVLIGKWDYAAQWYTLRGELEVTVYRR